MATNNVNFKVKNGVNIGTNLIFDGTGTRIQGDFSNASIPLRAAFQTSTANAGTTLMVVPNGTGNVSQLLLRGSSAADNDAYAQFLVSSIDVRVSSGIAGTGTYVPLTFYSGGSERVRIDTAGQIGIGGANFGTAGQVLTSGGPSAAPSWTSVVGGSLTLTDDTTTNSTHYLTLTSSTSGTLSALKVSSSKLQFNPSTGNLGLGTNTLNQALCIGGAGRLIKLSYYSNDRGMYLYQGSGYGANLSNNLYIDSAGTATAAYATGGVFNIADNGVFAFSNFTGATVGSAPTTTERMRIDATGLVGMGGTPVISQGHLQIFDTVAGGAATSARFVNTSGTANSNVLLSLDPGNNGISVRDAQLRAVNDGSNNINLQFWTAAANTPTEKFRIGHAGQIGLSGANFGTAGQAIISNGSSAAYWGSPITLSTTNATWSTNGTISVAVGQLAWKNYGNGHTIFDASAGTSPTGSAVNSTNSAQAWTTSYPTLMGWNGTQTYGVRVDSARVADSATTAANYLPLAGGTMSGNIAFGTGSAAATWTGVGTSYIANGPGDGASYATYNLRIQSHWGIGFPAYDNVNRIVFDTRSGHISATGNGSFSGSMTVGADAVISGTTYVYGGVVVGHGGTSSSITMSDTDEGARSIHCNSNRIGFLTQAGGWGSYCIDDGSWYSDANMYAAGNITASTMYTGWYRSNGNAGWYSETYGGGIYMTDSLYVRTYNNKSFWAHSFVEVANNYGTVSGAQTIDPRNGSMVSMTLNGATTFTFIGAPVSGNAASFTLELTNGGSYTITWPTGTKWSGGAAPTLTGSGTDILAFYTRDGGTTWRGVLVSKDNR